MKAVPVPITALEFWSTDTVPDLYQVMSVSLWN
jgi:hypothetical protein